MKLCSIVAGFAVLAVAAVGCGAPASSRGGSGGALSTGGMAGSGTGGATAGTSGGASAAGGAAAGGARVGGAGGNASNTGGAVGGSAGGSAAGGASALGAAGGASDSGGAGPAAGGGGPGRGGAGGATSESCESGSTTTTWASACPAAPATTCTAGTWSAGGPQNDACCSAMTLRSESAHFAVYGDEASTTAALAKAAVDHLETVWSLYFGNPLYMREPFCTTATKIKANIHVHSSWGLTGGGFGGNRMGMWIGTAGLTDHWGLAHEFMHGVQSVAGGLDCGQSNTCGWIFESHANWAAQQQIEYHASSVHCSEMLANAPHLYLGSTRDRYCNWQFMEYLKDKYCMSAVNAIWTGSPQVSDPYTAIMNFMQWKIADLNDFIGEWAMHNVTWDYQDPPPQSTAGGNQGALYRKSYGLLTDASKNERRLRLTKVEPLDKDYASHRRFMSPFAWAPQRFGYNVVRLFPDAGATSVTVTFRGITSAPASPDWRWGLVATDSAMTKARYSGVQKGADGQLSFCVSPGDSLFLIVAATPSTQQTIVWDQPYATIPRYPYMIQLGNAWPDGFQGGKQDPCPSGTVRISNGGGCGPSSLPASVYVGPYALVTGNGVTGTAKIQDHAQVLGGRVTDATVGALTIVGSAFSVTGGATQAMTTFYPLDYFEGRTLSGGGLVGDVELRADHVTGICSGFVDASTCTAPGTDSTPKPPYVWR